MSVLRYNTSLHTTILDEYYRVYPYLCAAVKNFVKDHVEAEVDFFSFAMNMFDFLFNTMFQFHRLR